MELIVVVGLIMVNDVIKTTDVSGKGDDNGGPIASWRAANDSSSLDTAVLLVLNSNMLD